MPELSVANILGVPLATLIGQVFGWHAAFPLVAAAALATAGLVRLCLPPMPAHTLASPLRELDGLRQPLLWLTLGTAAVGFGGLFAVYICVAPMLVQVTGVGERAVPPFLALIGSGMVAGSLFGGWLADRGVLRVRQPRHSSTASVRLRGRCRCRCSGTPGIGADQTLSGMVLHARFLQVSTISGSIRVSGAVGWNVG